MVCRSVIEETHRRGLGPIELSSHEKKRIISESTPEVVRSKAYVCGRSNPGIAASNPVKGMAVLLLSLLCVV